MLIVTYSEARRTFSSVLDRAKKDGAVLIKRSDGSRFRIIPETGRDSPLDLPPLAIALKKGELEAVLVEAREAHEKITEKQGPIFIAED